MKKWLEEQLIYLCLTVAIIIPWGLVNTLFKMYLSEK